MFLKLVKHELHAAYRLLLPLFGGLMVMALMARASIWLIFEKSYNGVLNILGVLFLMLFILACGATIILTMVLMMVRFAKSVHGDEGYLTHTLPVSLHSILLSRLLVSFLSLLSAYAAVYLGYRLCTLGLQPIQEFRQQTNALLKEMNLYDAWAIPKAAGTLMVGMLSSILQIFAAVCIGHSFAKSKVGMSILFYFVLYIGTQIINSCILIAWTILVQGTGTDSLTTLQNGMGYFSILYVVYAVVFYFLSWIMMKKKLNLA